MTEVELNLLSDAAKGKADALMVEAAEKRAKEAAESAAAAKPKRENIRVALRVRPPNQPGESVAWDINKALASVSMTTTTSTTTANTTTTTTSTRTSTTTTRVAAGVFTYLLDTYNTHIEYAVPE
jgi:hypothetical protein